MSTWIAFAALVFSVSVYVSVRRKRLETKAHLLFELRERATGELMRIGLGGDGWLATRRQWIDEYTHRAAAQGRHYWPQAEQQQIEVRLVATRFG